MLELESCIIVEATMLVALSGLELESGDLVRVATVEVSLDLDVERCGVVGVISTDEKEK